MVTKNYTDPNLILFINNIYKFENYLLNLLDDQTNVDNIKSSNMIGKFIQNIIQIIKHFKFELVCFPISFIYIKRLKELGTKIILKELKLLLTLSLLVSVKMFDDVGILNSEYAKCFKLETLTLNLYEDHFLQLIKFNLFISNDEYDNFLNSFNLV